MTQKNKNEEKKESKFGTSEIVVTILFALIASANGLVWNTLNQVSDFKQSTLEARESFENECMRSFLSTDVFEKHEAKQDKTLTKILDTLSDIKESQGVIRGELRVIGGRQ